MRSIPHGYTQSVVQPGERVTVQCSTGYDTYKGSYVCVSNSLYKGEPPACSGEWSTPYCFQIKIARANFSGHA